MANLDGKVALITGAKGGLGTAVTQAFLAAGARVAGVSRSIRPDDFPHPEFLALPAELSRTGAASDAVARAIAHFGRIDVLVHLVGGFAGGTRVEDTPEATLEAMLDLNLRAAFQVLSAVIPPMRAQRSGRILAVASRQAVEPAALLGAYNASKAALVALVRTVALENRESGITANTVLPGAMATPGNQGPNLIPTSQVAALLAALAADEAAAISGAAIPIYGTQL